MPNQLASWIMNPCSVVFVSTEIARHCVQDVIRGIGRLLDLWEAERLSYMNLVFEKFKQTGNFGSKIVTNTFLLPWLLIFQKLILLASSRFALFITLIIELRTLMKTKRNSSAHDMFLFGNLFLVQKSHSWVSLVNSLPVRVSRNSSLRLKGLD